MRKKIELLFTALLLLNIGVYAACGNVATINGVSIFSAQVRTTFCQGETIVLTCVSPQPNACNDCNLNSYTTWSNGSTGNSIIATSTGTYIAWIHQDSMAAMNCGVHYNGGIIYSDTFHITVLPQSRPIANPGTSQTLPGCGSDTLGANPTISFGHPPYTITWTPMTGLSYTSLTIANPVVSNIYSPVTYTLIVVDSLGCTDTAQVTITPALTAPLTPPTISRTGCQLSLQPSPNFTYQWFHNNHIIPGATNPTYTEDSSGSWYAVATSTVHPLCSVSSNYISIWPYLGQQLCMVTLDSSNTYNLAVWDKTSAQNVESFRIYKQSNSTSQFVLLGEQGFGELSIFADSTSHPTQSSSSYKISILDSCHNESTLSPLHKTILLSSNLGVNNTVNLSWNAYQGFTYNNFEIWRSGNGDTMMLLTTVANTTLAYIDNNPPQQAFYQIRIVNPNGCNPTRSSFDYTTVRSNIVNSNSTGIDESLNFSGLEVFPNPSDGKISVRINSTYTGIVYIMVRDALGRIITQLPAELVSGLNTANLAIDCPGFYSLEISKDRQHQTIRKTFIIR